MRLHPRHEIYAKAHCEIEKAILECRFGIENLTTWELVSILNQIQAGWIKTGIRDERHPGELDKPGGLE